MDDARKIAGMPTREEVARVISPDAWAAFDRQAVRKEWTPEERAEELAEWIGKGNRLSQSLAKADAILALMRPDEAMVEAGARAIQAVKGGVGYDYADFCRDASRACLTAAMKQEENGHGQA